MRFFYFLSVFFVLIPFSFHSFATDCEQPIMPSEDKWNSWLNEIKLEALEKGISKETINNELNNIKPQSKIILRDRCQPESTISLKEYLFYRVDKARIFAGKRMLKKYTNELDKISKHFDIQPRFIIAILGMESFYGKNQGKIKTIDAVTTLAFDRRRSNFYKKQLFATLKIIDQNLVSSENLKGSWGGALGMTQMLPTTFIDSGYDWDGGGVDIWNSYLDSFASIANYLTTIDKNRWSFETTWGREIIPPDNIEIIYDSLKQINPKGCGAVKSRSIPKKLSEWQKMGFRDINGDDLPKNNTIDARLIAPDGINGRLFLVYQNYKNILYYNCSSYYAISIGLLSDEISN
tara:strand:- start:971 stop:2017 length:1047 start_codon:yes stop_codon:yes gene_type:complete